MLRVRGAPAIGVAAAMGVVVGMQTLRRANRGATSTRRLREVTRLPAHQPADGGEPVLGARPHGARRAGAGRAGFAGAEAHSGLLLREALAIEAEDRAACAGRSAQAGAALIRRRQGVLTHCNAGGLATADYGTALAVLFTAAEQGQQFPRLRRRDAAAAAGRPADGVGAAAARHRRDADLRQHGRPGDEGGPRAAGHRRRRPHRRQRRHGQQDRHLRRGAAGAGPRHSRSTSPPRRARST